MGPMDGAAEKEGLLSSGGQMQAWWGGGGGGGGEGEGEGGQEERADGLDRTAAGSRA